jgi:hypothetical protein
MTADDFRKLAKSFPDTEERAHMNHPDFRVKGKIFATLGAPDTEWGMVALTPEEQQNYLDAAPEAFKPAAGAWGRGGSTLVRLKAAKKAMVKQAMGAAWAAKSAAAGKKKARG